MDFWFWYCAQQNQKDFYFYFAGFQKPQRPVPALRRLLQTAQCLSFLETNP
jgi:hypothetical protein